MAVMRWPLVLCGVAALVVSAFRGLPARADTLPSRFHAPPGAAADRREERFPGNGLAREFLLHWRGLRWGGEECDLDTRRLLAGRDYTLDYEAGVLRLTQPPAPESRVRLAFLV